MALGLPLKLQVCLLTHCGRWVHHNSCWFGAFGLWPYGWVVVVLYYVYLIMIGLSVYHFLFCMPLFGSSVIGSPQYIPIAGEVSQAHYR